LTATWHERDSAAVAAAQRVDVGQGLDAAEVARRLAVHGPNLIAERAPRHWALRLADQFRDFMILVLVGAGVVAGIVGEPQDAAAIVVIVLLNGGIGFIQEQRAARAIAALRRLAATHAHVLRGGAHLQVSAAELVPGDVLLLEAGHVVPADLRVVEAAQLSVDESALTGESVPVDKLADRTVPAAAPLAERSTMLYKGCTLTRGRARGIVVATGMATELGRIAALLAAHGRASTPLQQRLAQFGKRLAWAVLAICALVFAAGWWRGEPLLPMLLTAVSLAVAAIPEALPAVVTVLLALGARTLVRHEALIRRLPAVETLGSVSVICSDKTGTLTQNRMQVQELVACGAAAALHEAMALANDAHAGPDGALLGDPTEVALLAAARDAGVDKAARSRAGPSGRSTPSASA
jgi:P-type Ca2+ transporter type 2C